MIWNETKECMSRDEMTNLQGARLSKLVDRVYHNVDGRVPWGQRTGRF